MLHIHKDHHKFDQEIQFISTLYSKFDFFGQLYYHTRSSTIHRFFFFLNFRSLQKEFLRPARFLLYLSMDMKVVIKLLKSRADFFYVEKRSIICKDFTLWTTASFLLQFIFLSDLFTVSDGE